MSYCYVHSLERYQFFSIHSLSTCIIHVDRHVQFHNTAKSKHQGGGLQIVYIFKIVYATPFYNGLLIETCLYIMNDLLYLNFFLKYIHNNNLYFVLSVHT